MQTSKKKFLADFHIHSTFSDGKLSIPEIIDLYGSHGFGAIAITDHTAEKDTWLGKAAKILNQVITEENFPLYKKTIEIEAERAWQQYKMLVIPGIELSQNSVFNSRSAHILGLGISQFMYADGNPLLLTKKIRDQGGLSIAAHPVFSGKWEKQTYYLWSRREELRNSFDAWEVASGSILFTEVQKETLPKIANSDLHIKRQLHSWKTVFHCELHQEAIFDAIRKQELDFVYY